MSTLTDVLPVSSRRSIGEDPLPYVHPDGSRRGYSTYATGCYYKPRPDFTHRPVAPSERFCQFREEYWPEAVYGAFDLGEYAEEQLKTLVDDGTRDARLFRRFLELCAAVLPRPYAEYAARWEGSGQMV